MKSFSLASVILSYFLVAGGMFTAMLALGYMKNTNEGVGYLVLAAGAFVGGFVAARASRGRTIVEPAIGGLAVVATIVGLIAGSSAGHYVWAVSHDEVVKAVALFGASGGLGALAGAAGSEKLFGEPSESTAPWLLYTAFATFGSCLMVTLIAAALAMGGATESAGGLAKMLLVGLALGCFVGGGAVGASARSRPLVASLVGGGAGVAGFCLLVTRTAPKDNDAAAGIAVLAVGGAVVTMLGALVGWAAVGKRQAAA
jgi:hypothetical protein